MAPAQSLFVTTATSSVKEITVKSPAFKHMGLIPQKYCGDGANVNPPLQFGKVPPETKSMVMIVEDQNAPVDTWVHWLVWDIMPTAEINEGAVPGTEGLNAFHRHHYQGPLPPDNTRYYFFRVYALNTVLRLHYCSTKYEVMKAMKDHVVGYGELIGSYEHSSNRAHVEHIAPDIYC
jgi:Raf kinase inhibitor-like YbhB/YbcL family protein